MNKYYKVFWNEFSFDEDWGTSIWYLEVDSLGIIIRQLEVYQNSNRIKFDEENLCDSYGSLGDQPVLFEELEYIEISESDFLKEWKIKSLNLN